MSMHQTPQHDDISRSQDGSILQISAKNDTTFTTKKMDDFIALLQAHPELALQLHKVSDTNNALDQEVTRDYQMAAGYLHPDRVVTESVLINYLVSKNADQRVIDRLARAYVLEAQFREDDKHKFGFTQAEAGMDAQGRVAEILSHGEITSPTLNEMINPNNPDNKAEKDNMINYLKENARKSNPDNDPLDTYTQAQKYEPGISF
jgi:hypothetical protein